MPPTTLRLLPELESSLGRLTGVQAVRVVTGADARPTEIHVLATREKTPKQLVRDIQSVAMAQFDLDVDHRIVSIVQLDADDTPGGNGTRVLIATITAQTTGLEATATVTLASGGTLYDGSATAPATPSSRPRLIARATLNAVAALMPVGAVDIEYAATVQVGGREVAVSIVQLVTPEGESIVTGSALVRGDEADAVARSVLDALNRRLGS
ncbi:MAG TPA: hypothetical protein VFQ85_00890 [Mycobacteriales bacterium]|jgi:hypothetical protein|nr:hypothetical protein [Mycobacteriales bacterium]